MGKPALLALQNGEIFFGSSAGCDGNSVGEIVFNTSFTGYQEILTDPSYTNQIILFTCPHIGNTGFNSSDHESFSVCPRGVIIREQSTLPSSWRSQGSLFDYFIKHSIVAISNIDTRYLTCVLRETGVQAACIMAGDEINPKTAMRLLMEFDGLSNADLVKQVTTKKQYTWEAITAKSATVKFHIVVYDFGVKHSILRQLTDCGANVTVVPAQTSLNEVLSLQPDGIVLSNGPGDPNNCPYAVEMAKQILKANIPILGICFGHQILAIASGANVVKMKFGHHGTNHPVRDIKTKKVFITSQNHGFAVDEASLPSEVQVTHRSLFDNTIQGLMWKYLPVFSFQGHPEAGPGAKDMNFVFQRFIDLILSSRF